MGLTPGKDDTEVHTVDDAIEQPPSEVPPETPVDDQIARTVPAAEDAVLEPPPADIIEIAPEEIVMVESSEASKPELESAQTDVEESVILPEPEDKANEKSQQREGMHPFS